MTKKKKLTQTAIKQARTAVKEFKGVSLNLNNPKNLYRATFYGNNTRLHLGCYNTPQDAALAYNKKAKEVYGNTANAKKLKKWNVIS